ncbi:brix domain-containing protein Rpf2 [Schizosaccharomyces cryophilus OY26]|uniref:Ribosome production factor 2 homolog n=1 Tax=Schizosaccharomyces cryophilus (strain OY26 / ATCC MYA-4695 / CBS 11777 / NBRC 106824 / NRRL Y48691) TaxID=653667 RepID=S9W0D4_SCHCR|nr:brix domain-containing protein Rpf2 [Schizosaccharomyces cryophilus OY26]EPY51520.1 brix domain-containing protein Rpf2 [Schizosaccharomyces cryophilus OY26]
MLRQVKPKNARTKRVMDKREPKVVEGAKIALFLRGNATSQLVVDALHDLYALKKPFAVNFQKKNPILPFEDSSSLEFFSEKNDAGLAVCATHNKKRPHNLAWIRFFDYHVLDMIELGIVDYKPISSFHTVPIVPGTKPMMLFQGPSFDSHPVFRHVKSLFLDFFRGEPIQKLDSAGLSYVIVVSAGEASDDETQALPKVNFRVYSTKLLKSNTNLPRVELEEMGPRLDFSIRRVQAAQADVLGEALKKPKTQEPKTKKNVDVDLVGNKVGRVHVDQQDLSNLQTRKMKGLKRSAAEEEEEEEESEVEDEDVVSDVE